MLSDDELVKIRGLVAHSKVVSERTGARGPLFDWQHVSPLLDHIDALRARLATAEALLRDLTAGGNDGWMTLARQRANAWLGAGAPD